MAQVAGDRDHPEQYLSKDQAWVAGTSSSKWLLDTVLMSVHLTIELSGRARYRFRTGERAIYCEHRAATMPHGPLQRVVRQRASKRPLPREVSRVRYLRRWAKKQSRR